jgi:hypothetical protein
VQSFTFTAADGAGLPAGYVAASVEQGIAVRDGRFCAHPLIRKLCGENGEALCASIGIGTTEEHVDRLVGALHRLVTSGARWTYARVDGGGHRRPTRGTRIRWASTATCRSLRERPPATLPEP